MEVWFIQIKLGRTLETTGLFKPGVVVKKVERQMHEKPLERNGWKYNKYHTRGTGSSSIVTWREGGVVVFLENAPIDTLKNTRKKYYTPMSNILLAKTTTATNTETKQCGQKTTNLVIFVLYNGTLKSFSYKVGWAGESKQVSLNKTTVVFNQ